MSLACETEYQVRNEYALRFSIVSKPTPVLEYIKTISSLVGASHILAVFDECDAFKVFFDDKGYVDALIRTGIHVMGRHVRVDYVVPPGVKVVLSNVDPVISNFDLLRFLSSYGTVVSPIIRPPISDDVELCHISFGIRHVYMNLDSALPDKFIVKCEDVVCSVKVRVGDHSTGFQIKEDDSDTDAMADDVEPIIAESHEDSSSPVVVSVQSAVLEDSMDEQVNSVEPTLNDSKPVLKKRRGRVPKSLQRKHHARITPASRAAKKIKLNFKHKWVRSRRIQLIRNCRKGRKPGRPVRKRAEIAAVEKETSSSVDDSSPSDSAVRDEATDQSSIDVLTTEKLELFLEEVKHNRAPLEVAKKFLGSKWTPEMMALLIKQLENYKIQQTSLTLKARVGRVIKSMIEAMKEAFLL